MIDQKALWEAVKEPLRLLVLALIPFAVAYLTSLPYEWAVFATVALRALDKYLHVMAKEKSAESQNTGYLGLKGLTNF